MFDNEDEITQQEFLKLQDDSNGIVVIPWIIKNGYINDTEKGIVPQDANPEDYSDFKQIFTGREIIQVVWENSTHLIKPQGINKYVYSHQAGYYYLGQLISGSTSQGVEIDNVVDNDDFLATKDYQTIKMRFDFPPSNLIQNKAQISNQQSNTHYFFPTKQDRMKFYSFPEITGKSFFMITNAEPETNSNGEIVAYEITFSSISDYLAKSGLASDQKIQYCAPGDVYSFPQIIYNEVDNKRKKVVGVQVIETPQITHLQIEMFGAAGLVGVLCEGRVLEKDDLGNYSFNETKFILPYKFTTPQNDNINRTGTPTKNFFYFPKCSVELCTSKSWDEARKAQDNAIATNDSVGKLVVGVKDDWSSLETGVHKSNSGYSGFGRYDYNNDDWKPTGYIEGEQPSYDCKGDLYTDNTVTLNDNMSMLDILVANSFCFLNQLELPLGFKSSKPYKIHSFPLVGGLISGCMGDFTVNSHSKEVKPLEFGMFMDCDTAGRYANRGVLPEAGSGEIGMFLSNFCGKDNSNWTGIDACNTTICFSLTDKIKINNVNYDTKYLGQTRYENGEYILDNHLPLLYKSGSTTQPTNNKFIIDRIVLTSIFSGKVRISAYSAKLDLVEPQWATTLITESKWTGSLRNWVSIIKTGGWDSRFCIANDDFTYPRYPEKNIGGKALVGWRKTFDSGEYGDYSHGQDITTKGFSHIDGDKFWRTNSDVPQSFTFRYDELGLISVDDKESFFEKIDGMRIFYNGSFINLYQHDYFYNEDRNCEVYNKSHYLSLIDDSTKEYELPICGIWDEAKTAINVSDLITKTNINFEYLVLCEPNYGETQITIPTFYILSCKMTIRYDEESFTITLKNDTKMVYSKKEGRLENKMLYCYNPPIAGIFGGRKARITSTLNVDRLEFVPK